MKQWESLKSFFDELNTNVNYLVLRNYEEFFDVEFLSQNGADIDLLCRDREQLRKLLEAGEGEPFHCDVMINKNVIPLDIREVGDGYYDRYWEEKMLQKPQLYRDFCYVMDKKTYFYTLAYHALIHKYNLSRDYLCRLKTIGDKMGINVTENNLRNILETYMLEHRYKYTYPDDRGVIINFQSVNKSMIRKFDSRYLSWRFKDKEYLRNAIKGLLRMIKSFFMSSKSERR